MCSSGGQTLEPENIMWKDQKNRHGKWYSGGSSWGKQRRQRGRRPGHRTEYSAHVFNVKTSPAGSCSIFPQSTWAPCPKRWDFLCIQVTGCNILVPAKKTGLMWVFRNLIQKFKILGLFWGKTFLASFFEVFTNFVLLCGHICTKINENTFGRFKQFNISWPG